MALVPCCITSGYVAGSSLPEILNCLAVSCSWKMAKNAPDSMSAAACIINSGIRFSCKREYEYSISKGAQDFPSLDLHWHTLFFLIDQINMHMHLWTTKLNQYITTVWFIWLYVTPFNQPGLILQFKQQAAQGTVNERESLSFFFF